MIGSPSSHGVVVHSHLRTQRNYETERHVSIVLQILPFNSICSKTCRRTRSSSCDTGDRTSASSGIGLHMVIRARPNPEGRNGIISCAPGLLDDSPSASKAQAFHIAGVTWVWSTVSNGPWTISHPRDHLHVLQKGKIKPGAVAYTCNPSTLGG